MDTSKHSFTNIFVDLPKRTREYEKNSVKTESQYSKKVFYDKMKKS